MSTNLQEVNDETPNWPSTSLVIALLVLCRPRDQRLPGSRGRRARASRARVDVPPGQATSAVVVLAGGCFWGVQGVFQHVKGVTSAVSGYAGGDKKTARYEIVSSGRTGHAEAVQVTFDPRQISYGRLLQIFFSVAHDPTQLNRQGPDIGTQYRSAIFPTNAEQAESRRPTSPSSIRPVCSRGHRHENRIGPSVLSGRELPSGLPDAQPQVSLHRRQRPAENRGPETLFR